MKNQDGFPDISKLSLRDKINQTIVIEVKNEEKIDFCPGGAFFFGTIITEADTTALDELRGKLSELIETCHIPPFITSDFENGCGGMVKGLTPLPYMMGLGATDDLQMAYDYGKATALEARSIGANWTFSPVCDLNKNKRNPLVNSRALTDDEELACKLLPQIVRGMQENGLTACAKHFPGDGMDYRDQHITTTVNSLNMKEWNKSFGAVYKSLIDAGVQTIMAGHISLPDYPQEYSARFQMALPATLSKELITTLLKEELEFDGIVVTDSLRGMGGFLGWYDTQEKSEIESFKSGCDMLLWPSKNYADNLEKAILSGEVPMERLDDAVRRVLRVKQRMGMFDKNYKQFKKLSDQERMFVERVQQQCSEKSITLLRDLSKHFPLRPEHTRKLGIVVVTEYEPAKREAYVLKEEFEKRGFEVEYYDETTGGSWNRKAFFANNDLVIYALFSRAFRPKGFIDFQSSRATLVGTVFKEDYAVDKTIIVSFGSPYFGGQYFERAQTYVNAYSMLGCVAKAFVRSACGEIKFEGKCPVKL